MDLTIDLEENDGVVRARGTTAGVTSKWVKLPNGTNPRDTEAILEAVINHMGLLNMSSADINVGRRDYVYQPRLVAKLAKKIDTKKYIAWMITSPKPIKWLWENFILERVIVAAQGWFWK